MTKNKSIVPNLKKGSLPAKVLSAAIDLADSYGSAIPIERLVVRSWELYPEEFSLGENTNYPCSNKVIVSLSGKRGLVEKGFLSRRASKTYAVTAAGRAALGIEEKRPPSKVFGVAAGVAISWLRCSAYAKWIDPKSRNSITQEEARMALNLSPRTNFDEADIAARLAGECVDSLQKALDRAGQIEFYDGRVISEKEFEDMAGFVAHCTELVRESYYKIPVRR